MPLPGPSAPEPISAAAPDLGGRAVLRQRWSDLVFVHWRVDPEEVRPLLPSGVEPDVHDGSSWVGLIPFRMSGTALLGGPPVPWAGSFTEINVRLYGVDGEGRRGVVFASLEASRLVAVAGARTAFSLPYFWARASAARAGNRLAYRSRRLTVAAPSTRIVAEADPGTVVDDPLSRFLTARFLLFQSRRVLGREHTLAMRNRHEPWVVHPASLIALDDGLVAAAGIRSTAGRAPDSVLYSAGVTTDFGLPSRLR